jgi:hypothetical protein
MERDLPSDLLSLERTEETSTLLLLLLLLLLPTPTSLPPPIFKRTLHPCNANVSQPRLCSPVLLKCSSLVTVTEDTLRAYGQPEIQKPQREKMAPKKKGPAQAAKRVAKHAGRRVRSRCGFSRLVVAEAVDCNDSRIAR